MQLGCITTYTVTRLDRFSSHHANIMATDISFTIIKLVLRNSNEMLSSSSGQQCRKGALPLYLFTMVDIYLHCLDFVHHYGNQNTSNSEREKKYLLISDCVERPIMPIYT